MRKVTVTIVIRNREAKFFLQKRDNKPEIAYPGAWCFPGGQVEQGEQPVDAMVREIEEELALTVTPEELVFVHEHHYDNTIDHVFFYIGNQVPDSIREGAGFGFFSLAELHRMELGFHEDELLPRIEQFISTHS